MKKYKSALFALALAPCAFAAQMASQPWVTNRIAAAVAPLATTGDVARAIAAIPVPEPPGNYEAVSNAAMNAVQPATLDAATNSLAETNAAQTAELESHASRLSQQSQTLSAMDDRVTAIGDSLDDALGMAQTATNECAATRAIVTTWEGFLDGSNVVFSITNYISGAYSLDEAKLKILELRDGSYQEVYNSRDEILLHLADFETNKVNAAFSNLVEAVAASLAKKADKDWGKYTSAGGVAPEDTVYMTAPNTVFAGGLEYERVAVGEGAIFVLTTHGAPVWTQGDEGTFKFQDDGGTNYFGFAKTDSYTVGADTDGISVADGLVTLTYNITMSGRPCVWYRPSLSPLVEWEQLNLPDGSPASGASHVVSWETNPDPGTQVCYINVGSQPKGFFKATIEAAGEAKFMTNMPADLSGGIISTNTATGVNGVVKPSFDGSSVIWTWSAR